MEWQFRPKRRSEINAPGHAHGLTFSCYLRYPFLKSERTCVWLAQAIEQSRQRYDFALWAYVFMPDHVHLLLYPRRPDYQMKRILFSIKQPAARKAIAWLRKERPDWIENLTRQRGARTETLFWQSGGGYDRNLDNRKTLLATIDYLHLNPVRKNLVQRACDWHWSSAAGYEGGTSPIPLDPIPKDWLE